MNFRRTVNEIPFLTLTTGVLFVTLTFGVSAPNIIIGGVIQAIGFGLGLFLMWEFEIPKKFPSPRKSIFGNAGQWMIVALLPMSAFGLFWIGTLAVCNLWLWGDMFWRVLVVVGVAVLALLIRRVCRVMDNLATGSVHRDDLRYEINVPKMNRWV